MRGVITRAQVLAHPIVIAESFGLKVLVRAVFSGARETFLEVVSRCAEEDAHQGMDEIDLVRTVKRFITFECRVRDVYGQLSRALADAAGAPEFFATLSAHEEGHAVVLSCVLRELRRGRLWKPTRDLHAAIEETFDAALRDVEAEVGRGVTLARALDLVEALEGSEINVVFDTLSGCVDMRSRTRLERFFVHTRGHLAYCAEQGRALRARHGLAPAPRA